MADDKEIKAEIDAAFEAEFGKSCTDGLPLPAVVAINILRFALVITALYFFLVALGVMGSSFQALAGPQAGELFGGVESPIVGLMIGILATVLVQSSSTTTAIIVVLVGSELIPVESAIPMIMGANIGTSVTNTIVSLGFIDDKEAYRRGFAGATVHDMFNYLNVLCLLPLELFVDAVNPNGGGLLFIITKAMTPDEVNSDAEKPENKLKEWTSLVKDKIISANKDVITDYAQGRPEASDCDDAGFQYKFANKKIEPRTYDYCSGNATENEATLAIAQEAFDNARLIKKGIFFENDLDDKTAGAIGIALSLAMVIIALLIIVKTLTAVVKGPAKQILSKALNYDFVGGGYLSIAVGVGITVAVQSSSITTSILTPLVAVGTLSVENMFPFTLGANIGTTATGLIAALEKGKPEGLQIALVHLFFNIIGTLIWYPLPFMRKVPISMAKFLGDAAAELRVFPVIYIFVAFLIYPAFFFGLSVGFNGTVGGKIVASIALLLFLFSHLGAIYWYKKKDGRNKLIDMVEKYKAKRDGKTTDVGSPVTDDV